MHRHNLLPPLAGALLALLLAASAGAAPGVGITIRHQVRGCHAWAIGQGAYRAAQTIHVRTGAVVTVTDNDLMPHRLIQLAGARVTFHNLPSTMAMMGLRGPFAPGMMGRMGVGTRFELTKPGTYRFRTRAGEDYMEGVKTIGEDNVLTLTVIVS